MVCTWSHKGQKKRKGGIEREKEEKTKMITVFAYGNGHSEVFMGGKENNEKERIHFEIGTMVKTKKHNTIRNELTTCQIRWPIWL